MIRSSYVRPLAVAALIAGGLFAAGPAAAVSSTPGGISTPGYLTGGILPHHRHVVRASAAIPTVRVVQPRRSFQSWEGCDKAGYRYMETPNYEVPVLCR